MSWAGFFVVCRVFVRRAGRALIAPKPHAGVQPRDLHAALRDRRQGVAVEELHPGCDVVIAELG